MKREESSAEEYFDFLPTFPELKIVPTQAELVSDPPIVVPGTLQIEVLDGTGIPVLAPIPSSDTALVLDNRTGGQMIVDGYLPNGSIRVMVPDGGTVAIARPTDGVLPQMRISVEKKRRVTIHVPNPWGGGDIVYWERKRYEVTGNGGDATGAVGSGRHSIDVNGRIA